MALLPDDLRPLPTAPYSERPDELPLDVEECRTAIWQSDGNVTNAASLLRVPSSRLRAFVKRSAYLSREVDEASERLVDKAESVALDALGDPERADAMARFILSSKGKGRGWGAQTPAVKVTNTGTLNITWGDGSSIDPANDAKTIEGEVF